MDSRLSGGSTQSEFIGGENKKKKKGLFGKLKKLTKSKSIDDTTGSNDDLMRVNIYHHHHRYHYHYHYYLTRDFREENPIPT